MPLLPSRSILAIGAVVDIALHSSDGPVLALDLGKRLKLPHRHLEPVLQALVREGILVGVRGPGGGYKLAKARQAISAYDVAEAVRTIEAEERYREFLGLLGTVVVAPLAEVEQGLASALSRIRVEDLVQAASLQSRMR